MMIFSRFQVLLIVFLLISLSPSPLYSQDPIPVQKSDNKVVIEGKVYYIHVVKAGQTVYSISRAYGLKEDIIEKENPGALSGLKIGQVLKIPVLVTDVLISPQKVDTLKYRQHTLLPGETLFSISRRYEVSLAELEEANPGIDPTSLTIGQTILIPKPEILDELVDFETHRVRRRETIYGISRQYGISEEELKRHNPELFETGLKMWQLLKIPVKKEIPDSLVVIDRYLDSIDYDAHIDSLHLDIFHIYDDYKDMDETVVRRVINVAYLIPFNYSREMSDSALDIGADVVMPEIIRNQRTDINEGNLSKPSSIPFLEFLEGSFIALDSLKKAGASINVRVFDTKRSPTHVRSIISSGQLNDMDLIIGPFFSFNVEIMSKFSKDRKIPLIVPFHSSDSLLAENPYLFQMSPSQNTELEAMAEYALRDPNQNILIIIGNDKAERERADYIRRLIFRDHTQYYPFSNPMIKVLVYDAAQKTDFSSLLRQHMTLDTMNLIILPSSNEAFVTVAVNQLFFLLRDYKIELMGMPQWSVFQNVELLYLHRLNTFYFTPYHFTYNSPYVNSFLFNWRRLFFGEPLSLTRKGCNYGFLGYDITFHFVQAYLKHGRRFIVRSEAYHTDLLMNEFEFRKKSISGGFENRSLKTVRFNTDLSVKSDDFIFPKRIRQYIPDRDAVIIEGMSH